MAAVAAKPRVALGSDHAGFPIKETILQYLQHEGYPVDDLGTWSEESVDYPDYGKAVGECVAAHKDVFGIAVCGTGIGMSIAANKVCGIRAAVAHDVSTARLAREHNDANVLALGGRVVNSSIAIEMVHTFLNTAFVGGRHARRVEKITIIEQDEKKKNERS
jgi:ribose 5-phosphate isomerase B